MTRSVWELHEVSTILMNQTEQGILGLDMDLRIALCNRWLSSRIGAPVGEMKGKSLMEVFPGLSETSLAAIRECLASGMPRVFSPVLRKAPMLPIPVKHPYVRLAPIADEAGRPAGLLLFIQDLSQQVGYEEEIKDRNRALLEATADHLFLLTSDGRYMVSNDRVERFGLTKGMELTGKSFDEVMGPHVAGPFRTAFNRVLQGEARAVIECPLEMDPKARWCQTTLYPVMRGQSLWAVGGSCRDITEQRNMEQHLRQAQKMDAIGALAGGVAHDFNNILSAILGYAQLALGEMDRQSPLYSYVQEIFKAGNRAADLVRQILTFSRQGREEVRPLDPAPLVKETFKMLRASLPATIEIRLYLAKSPLIVAADPTHIHQILMNLCTNAAHAMEGEGSLEIGLDAVDLDAKTLHGIAPLAPPHAGPYVRIRVSDTGCGIPHELLERIFDPYFTTKPQGKGTGLGLSVVWGIVQKLEGGLRVETARSKGTVFEIWIPRLESATDDYEWRDEDKEAIPRGAESILLVDDEPALLALGNDMLSGLGYRVTTRTNGPEALDLFRQDPGKFDLVITDMAMPHMSGLQLGRSLRETRPDIAIILCTGFSEKVSEDKAMELGFNGFISKPILKRTLAETVRKAMEMKKEE